MCLGPGLNFLYKLNNGKRTRDLAQEFLETVQVGSVTTVSRELTWYKLGLVGVQDFGWNKGGTVRKGEYILYMEKGNKYHQLGTVFFLYTTEYSVSSSEDKVC